MDDTGFGALSGGEWAILAAIWILSMVIIGAGIVYAMRERNVGHKETGHDEARAHHQAVLQDAMATLDQRLARGEIDSVAYDAQRERLERRQWNGTERRAATQRMTEGDAVSR